MSRFTLNRIFATLTLTAFVSTNAIAKININAIATGDTTFQDVSTENNGRRSLTTLSVVPKLNATYQTRTFKGLWTSTFTHIERDNDDTSQQQEYGEYSYAAQWAPFEDLLTFQASGALNYQNTNANNFLLSDFLTNADDLAKTRSNRLTSTLSIGNNHWFKAEGSATYSDTASERSRISLNALNNDSYQFTGKLSNGDNARFILWEIDGSYIDTERNTQGAGDFISRTGNGYVDVYFLKGWALRLNAQHEANQISNRNDTFSVVREFNSFGAGLTYRQSPTRSITLTANQSDSDISDDDGETFVGLDVAWALSTRTQVALSYGRRFYGESASANIRYNSKYFRTSFTYSEDVTNTSRLIANPENLGVFVCPITSTALFDCFQPNSLTYTPNADEQLVEITTQNLEFDDNIILRKSSNFQAGYDFSRVTLAFSWRYALDDYLDLNRQRRTYSFGSNLAYRLGNNTHITASVNYANITGRGGIDVFQGESDNWNATLGFERDIGENLSAKFEANYRKQEGDLNSGGGQFGNNFAERRISASIIYTYE